MPPDTPDQRSSRIAAVLLSSLNWQETIAIICQGDLDCGNSSSTVDDVTRAAFAKTSYLQDVLVYALRDNLPRDQVHDRTDVDFTFDATILNWVTDDDNFFFAFAFSKLFRALMTTRCGDRHGRPWGSRFSYPRCPTTFTYREGPSGRKEKDANRNRLAKARTATFVAPPGRDTTPAARLAEHLMRSARDFVTLYDQELLEPQKDVLRNAIFGRSCDSDALLAVWELGCSLTYGLPMDKLWTRDTSCVYTKHCVGYDEYVALQRGNDSAQSKVEKLARARTDRLKKAAQKQGEWQGVARNWWCQGFMRGVFRWSGDTKINKDITDDVQEVVNRIKSEDLYKKASYIIAIPAYLHKNRERITREACEGIRPGDIAGNLPVPDRPANGASLLDNVYSLLFSVATTKGAPKLQDCWML